ncbi:hypothetical protein [Acinetobacter sp. Ac_5812]|uniref:hypothetical protein n=1 Tax=Acinetobacter sp. Ac_5812 TaxID=1848937 RepID=UPI00148F732C|nr:hypothetical protein [Acinetobacter sp. Ac_5812]
MKNYKIKANDEAESKEAQELFFAIGAVWASGRTCFFDEVNNGEFIFFDGEHLTTGTGLCHKQEYKELTLPQLRDLVVLHRNDVKDTTHEAACGTYLFLDSSGDWHFFHKHEAVFYTIDGDISTFVDMPITLIKEQTQQPTEPEQGLISGADALRALADGKEVEFYNPSKGNQGWKDTADSLSAKEFFGGYFVCSDDAERINTKFRLKPHTITLSLEIPAPFEPKEGDEFYVIQPCNDSGWMGDKFGYKKGTFSDMWIQFGAWRTEEEIKQVVAALRGIKG